MPEDELMTAKEVAQFMRVEKRTVRRWVQMRRLPALRIGGTLRFRRTDLVRAMEKFEYGGDEVHDPAMG